MLRWDVSYILLVKDNSAERLLEAKLKAQAECSLTNNGKMNIMAAVSRKKKLSQKKQSVRKNKISKTAEQEQKVAR